MKSRLYIGGGLNEVCRGSRLYWMGMVKLKQLVLAGTDTHSANLPCPPGEAASCTWCEETGELQCFLKRSV